VGHAALFAMEKSVCEMLVFVAPPNQRGGIGTRMINTIIQLAYELGHQKIWLSVGPGNFVAQHLYTKCGFTYVMNKEIDRVEMMLDLQQYHQAAHIKVSAVMKRDVISINKNMSCEKAIETFLQHNIGSLPVVDDSGEVFGMLYQTNLIIATNVRRAVHEVATFEVPVLHENAALDSVIRLFQDPGIRCIPVLDTGGKLQGIVGRKDILAYYADIQPGRD
jgi:CBS domain-containing protein